MTVSNAKKFIHKAMADRSLRSAINQAQSKSAVTAVLTEYGLLFSDEDLNEAYHFLKTQCASEDEAGILNEFVMWWQMVQNDLPE